MTVLKHAILFSLLAAVQTAVSCRPLLAEELRLVTDPEHREPIQAVAISPDNRYMATSSGSGSVTIWDAATALEICSLPSRTLYPSFAFSPAGPYIAIAHDNSSVILWDVQNRTALKRFTPRIGDNDYAAAIASLSFSGDGTRLLMGIRSSLTHAVLWDTAAAVELKRFHRNYTPSQSTYLSRDGTLAITTEHSTIIVWDAKTGRQIRELHSGKESIDAAVLSGDGRLILSTNGDKTAREWDVKSGSQLRREPAKFTIQGMAVSTNAAVCLAIDDDELLVWSDTTPGPTRKWTAGDTLYTAAALSGDGALALIGTFDGTAQIWDVGRGTIIRRLGAAQQNISAIAASPDGTQLAIASGIAIRIWNIVQGKEIKKLVGHTLEINDLCWSPDGTRLVSASSDATLRVWEVSSARELTRLGVSSQVPLATAYSSDGTQIFAGFRGGLIAAWDTTSWTALRQLHTPDGLSSSVAVRISHDGKAALYVEANKAHLYDLAADKEIGVWEILPDSDVSIASSFDGHTMVVAGTDSSIQVWDIKMAKPLAIIPPDEAAIKTHAYINAFATFSPPQTMLVVSSRTGAQLVPVSLDKPTGVFSGQVGTNGAAYLLKGTTLATSSEHGTVWVWNVASLTRVASIQCFQDGSWLVTDGALHYDASVPEQPTGVHAVAGDRIASGDQLEAQFHVPNLLGRLLGGEHLSEPKVSGSSVGTARTPTLKLTCPAEGSTVLNVGMTNSGSGLGRLVLAFNGREVPEDLQPRRPDPYSPSAVITVDLTSQIGTEDADYTVAARVSDAVSGVLGTEIVEQCHYHKQKVSVSLVAQEGHYERITQARLSPNGKLLLTAGANPVRRLWDLETGRFLHSFDGGSDIAAGFVHALEFSKRGERVFSSDAVAARLWDTADGRLIWSVEASKVGSEAIVGAAADTDRQIVYMCLKRRPREKRDITIWDAVDGRALGSLAAADSITRFALSAHSDFVYAGDDRGAITVFDAGTHQVLHRFQVHNRSVKAVAVSPDSSRIVSSSADRTILSDAATGEVLWDIPGGAGAISLEFSRDGKRIIVKGAEPAHLWTTTIWDISSQSPAFARNGSGEASFSANGTEFLFWDDTSVQVFSLVRGSENTEPSGLSNNLEGRTQPIQPSTSARLLRMVDCAGAITPVSDIALSADGQYLVADGQYLVADGQYLVASEHIIVTSASGAVSSYGAPAVWDLAAGRRIGRLSGKYRDFVGNISVDSRRAVAPSFSDSASWTVYDLATATKMLDIKEPAQRARGGAACIGKSTIATYDALEEDGREHERHLTMWNPQTGKVISQVLVNDAQDYAATFFSDCKRLLTHDAFDIWLRDPKTGQQIRTFRSTHEALDETIFAVVSPKADTVLVGHRQDAELFGLGTGERIRVFEGHENSVVAGAFAPNDMILTGSEDSTARLWDVNTGREVARFSGHHSAGSSFGVKAVAAAHNGQYYVTCDGEGIMRFWSADSFQPLASLYSFANGHWAVVAPDGRFDTDDLDGAAALHWISSDDPLRPLPLEVFMRDYYTPRLLARVLVGEKLPALPDLAQLNRVQPEVAITRLDPEGDGNDMVAVTVDVKEATGQQRRDGQPVTLVSGAQDVRLFRDGRLVAYKAGPLISSGMASVKFEHIRLPQDGGTKVEFTAYAFNSDRVKSATARRPYAFMPSVRRKGNAYIIAMGVNVMPVPAWNLKFAAADAAAIADAVRLHVDREHRFQSVEVQLLISDGAHPDGARKESLRLALDKIQRVARPEDLVVLAYAGHGYSDSSGLFYLLPSDVRVSVPPAITPELLASAISSDELSEWLRDIDAGEITMVLDACQAAASVESPAFKPGPMGSKGLGQLAYDRRIRILAATQAGNVAIEYNSLRHGILTYALVDEGLTAEQADWQPRDRRITMSEWLGYAVQRVPQLQDEMSAGNIRPAKAGTHPRMLVLDAPSKFVTQEPALFDFASKEHDLVLSTLH